MPAVAGGGRDPIAASIPILAPMTDVGNVEQVTPMLQEFLAMVLAMWAQVHRRGRAEEAIADHALQPFREHGQVHLPTGGLGTRRGKEIRRALSAFRRRQHSCLCRLQLVPQLSGNAPILLQLRRHFGRLALHYLHLGASLLLLRTQTCKLGPEAGQTLRRGCDGEDREDDAGDDGQATGLAELRAVHGLDNLPHFLHMVLGEGLEVYCRELGVEE
mmetsp:Transcript_176708/g.566668  ORF Transcript_176708/g.566668 Transcript_176708/m.566668 type:complete len:216 (-) Transcript_176708:2072-2719(-)